MKKEIELTGKIYGVGILVSTIFYAVGVYLITPEVGIIKPIFIGGMIGIALILIAISLYKKTEHFDERAVLNMYKAGTTAFSITGFVILLFAIVTIFVPIKMMTNPG